MHTEPGQPGNRKPKDRDFIETPEGFLFCVVGYLHPPDKYTAYLKYSPAREGRWHRQGRAFQRELAFYHAHQVGQTLDYLQEHYPEYVHYCPIRDVTFSMVPHERLQRYYVPEQRLVQIQSNPTDRLEEELCRVVEAIQANTGIPAQEMGVTGSILLGIHDPAFSDIDLNILGRQNAGRLRSLMSAMALPDTSPMEEAYIDEWCQGVVRHFGLSYPQARWLISRRWNFVHYGTEQYTISLHPTRADSEIDEVYGDHIYRDAGDAYVHATIADAQDAIFLPASYRVEEVEILEGPQVNVVEICAYEGLFGQIGEAGERVAARGKLERIDQGPEHRLVIGSSRRSGQEYLLPVGL